MNTTRLLAFALIVGVTVLVTVWASRRTSSATDFFAAGRGISGPQNGLAIAGDLMSAATFVGTAALPHPLRVHDRGGAHPAEVGFLACWLGSVLSSERGATRSFDELQVCSQTGLGSEQATVSAH